LTSIISCHCQTMFGVDGRFGERWFRGPEYQQRASQGKQLRVFLKRVGLNAPSVNRVLIGAIEEGVATWDNQQKQP
jgi:hypothetical protein